jgi:hypothetical protein
MWRCPTCGRTFANRHQTHTCAALGDLERHVAGADPGGTGGVRPGARRGARPVRGAAGEDPDRAARPDDVDDAFAGWIAEAYDVGLQRHVAP